MKELRTEKVEKEQVDYNNHLRDNYYVNIFDNGFDKFCNELYTGSSNVDFKTVESHITYLNQAELNDQLVVYLRVLDYTQNEIHAWLVMKNSKGEKVATLEKLVKVNEDSNINFNIEKIKKYVLNNQGYPKESGRQIGISNKKN